MRWKIKFSVEEMFCHDRTNFPSNLIKGLLWVYMQIKKKNDISKIYFPVIQER